MGRVKPTVSLGLGLFILVLVLLIFVAAPIQLEWGMWGLAVTEVLLLAAAVVPALIFGWDLKEVFQVKRPSLRQIFGVLVLWLGGYIAVLAISLVITYFFPEGMMNVGTQLLDMFSSVPFPATFFIVAVMPAVCEEALNRGLLLHTFKSTNKWVAIIGVGLLFGVFHLDPYRFLGTAVLGILLTFIAVETRNILLPILFHLVNNSLSALSSLFSAPAPEVAYMPLASVGVFIILATVVPFLLLWGSRLLRTKEENKKLPRKAAKYVIAAVSAFLLFAVGIGITASAMLREPVFETSFSANVNNATPANELEFTASRADSYMMTINIQGDGAITNMLILSSTGEEIYNVSCGSMTYGGVVDLEAGDYLVKFMYDWDSEEYTPVSVDVIIR